MLHRELQKMKSHPNSNKKGYCLDCEVASEKMKLVDEAVDVANERMKVANQILEAANSRMEVANEIMGVAHLMMGVANQSMEFWKN